MAKQFTDVTVLVDRSGSMRSIKREMESAFDEFLLAHRAVPTSRVTLIQFDSDNPQEVVYLARPVGEAPRLEIDPRNLTPLLDALATAIDNTGKRFEAMPEADRPDQVLFVVITDGAENASREFDRRAVGERIERQQRQYGWQFVYLGANQDAIAEAAKIGIRIEDAIAYAASPVGTRNVMRSVSANTVAYASRESDSVRAFNEQDRLKAMDPDEQDKKKKGKKPVGAA